MAANALLARTCGGDWQLPRRQRGLVRRRLTRPRPARLPGGGDGSRQLTNFLARPIAGPPALRRCWRTTSAYNPGRLAAATPRCRRASAAAPASASTPWPALTTLAGTPVAEAPRSDGLQVARIYSVVPPLEPVWWYLRTQQEFVSDRSTAGEPRRRRCAPAVLNDGCRPPRCWPTRRSATPAPRPASAWCGPRWARPTAPSSPPCCWACTAPRRAPAPNFTLDFALGPTAPMPAAPRPAWTTPPTAASPTWTCSTRPTTRRTSAPTATSRRTASRPPCSPSPSRRG